jgi:2-polyprenyl-3-methyl-5-hydroxy-6-metoxy-1,4-benzoquinol methylase
MTNKFIHACTACGSKVDNQYLFAKKIQNMESDLIEFYRCMRCKTIFLGKYNDYYDDELYAYYSKYVDKKEEDIYDALTNISYEKVLRQFDSYGGGQNILDVGCGNGSFVKVALQKGYQAEGIDLSDLAVEVAQRFSLPVTKLDFFSKNISDSSRDIVTMFEVIEHLPNPVDFLRRSEKVVRPGGLIYLTTPNFNSLDRRVLGRKWNVFHREHYTYFTTQTLIKLIRNNTELDILHIETRNVSTELIAHFKNILNKNLLQIKPNTGINEVSDLRLSDARTIIYKSRWLTLVKQVANLILNATYLGSTIVIVLKRPIEVNK